MKNTFKIKRIKINGLFPYWVEDGLRLYYLFEVTRETTLKEIMRIEARFEREQILFATIDPDFPDYTSTIDASGIYIRDDANLNVFLFFDGENFYETYLVVNGNRKRLFPSKRKFCISEYLPF